MDVFAVGADTILLCYCLEMDVMRGMSYACPEELKHVMKEYQREGWERWRNDFFVVFIVLFVEIIDMRVGMGVLDFDWYQIVVGKINSALSSIISKPIQ